MQIPVAVFSSLTGVRCHAAILIFILVIFAGAAFGQQAPSAAVVQSPVVSPTPEDVQKQTITDFNEYWDAQGRDLARPIKMEFVVDYYDGGWNHLWGHCKGASGYAPCVDLMPFRSGDRVLVEGTIVPRKGFFKETLRITILERNVSPTVIDANGPGQLDDYMRLKAQIVTFDATLDSQKVKSSDPSHLEMVLLARGGYRVHLYLWAEEGAKLLPYKQGARLRLTGVYMQRIDFQTANLEIDLWVTKQDNIVYLGGMETDPRFNRPLVAIEQLQVLFQSNSPFTHIAGVVRSYTPGQYVVVRDETGEVRVQTLQTLPLKTGEWVEAVGVPFAGTADWLLRRGFVRHASPEAVAVRAEESRKAGGKLRLADQVLALSPSEAAAGLPVDLTAVVTWSSSDADFCYLQDSSGAVRMQLPGKANKDFGIDAQLHIWGTTLSGVFAPQIQFKKVEYISTALTPEAKKLSLEEAMTGMEEGRRVELRGHVQRMVKDANWTRVILSTQTGTFSALFPREELDENLIGAMVTVQGVCQATANLHRQLTSIELLARSRDDIRVEHTALSDPYAEPFRGIGTLRQYRVNAGANDVAHVKGVVTAYLPGHYIILQEGTEGLILRTEQGVAVAPGQMLEAAGQLGLENGRVVLREPVYRQLDGLLQVAPFELKNVQGLDESLDDRLVRVSGTLLSATLAAENLTFAIQSEKTIFTATLPRAMTQSSASNPHPGALLQLTGVYEIMRDEWQEPRGFRILLRSPADLVVLENPSWWTPSRALGVTCSLVGLIVMGFSWVAALRKRVTRQTDQIRTQISKEANLEAHNRAIVANASDCIFTTDLKGNFTSLNPAGERLLGYTEADALKMNFRDIIDPEDASAQPEIVSRLGTQDRAAARLEMRLMTKDGRRVWSETSACLIQTEGKAAGVLGVARDIQDRKLIQEQLQRAHDAAQANTEAKSAFLANMSHEIRTPMNGVIGMSNLMLETILTDEQRDYSLTIRNSAEALLTVLNDILDFSKIEAGKLQFETLDFDLVRCVEETIELLAARAAEKGIELALYIPPSVPRFLRGDPGRLRQVILNLVGNAVKFTSTGEVAINVSHLPDAGIGVCLRFEVRDSGTGISEADLSRLFQPFSQADASTTRRYGGTGLGLVISKQIVGLMQGTIGVESIQGKGSTFWFTARLEVQASRSRPPIQNDGSELKGVRVLFVHPNAAQRGVVHAYATAWGLRCETATHSFDAIQLLAKAAEAGDPFRIFVFDNSTHDINGIELAKTVRSDPRFSSMALIMLKAVDKRLSHEALQEIGLSGLATKPVHQDELFQTFRKAVAPSIERVTNRETASSGSVGSVKTDTPTSALRLLVAEDNVVNQRVVLLQLKKLRYTADVVGNGAEALQALERAKYDVVLMDCQMPEMDGYEASRRIKADARYANLRIIAMTANAMQGDRDKCLAAGMDDYVSKPIRVQELGAALERIQHVLLS